MTHRLLIPDCFVLTPQVFLSLGALGLHLLTFNHDTKVLSLLEASKSRSFSSQPNSNALGL